MAAQLQTLRMTVLSDAPVQPAQLQTMRMTVLSDAPVQPAQLQAMRMTVLSDAPVQPAQLQTMRMTVLHDDTEASLGGSGDDGRSRRRKRRTKGACGRGFSLLVGELSLMVLKRFSFFKTIYS